MKPCRFLKNLIYTVTSVIASSTCRSVVDAVIRDNWSGYLTRLLLLLLFTAYISPRATEQTNWGDCACNKQAKKED